MFLNGSSRRKSVVFLHLPCIVEHGSGCTPLYAYFLLYGDWNTTRTLFFFLFRTGVITGVVSLSLSTLLFLVRIICCQSALIFFFFGYY